MIRKVVHYLRELFHRFRSKTALLDSTETGETVLPGAEDTVVTPDSPCIRRIRKVFSYPGVRQRKGNATGVWTQKAESFADAYRFMLRICDPKYVKTIRQAGHIRYKVVLPDNEGSVLLSDKTGNRKNTIAVMRFDIGKIPELKEIRFYLQ